MPRTAVPESLARRLQALSTLGGAAPKTCRSTTSPVSTGGATRVAFSSIELSEWVSLDCRYGTVVKPAATANRTHSDMWRSRPAKPCGVGRFKIGEGKQESQ